ncbi:hypothetical protein GLX30_22015 [Streptomyces sp. Tu 2975]|uniref:hypothetical protein n=1 Tax=Streptomyces sp. Tu 2975 TaxID=2676871 RepID=UPI001358CBBA|nr:hypothetical protein [Streptomyces sp. Tu 2975]QIP86261.1 hypothetical protein GLX30_22015 [Streptomyces sp. Tu 2975]
MSFDEEWRTERSRAGMRLNQAAPAGGGGGGASDYKVTSKDLKAIGNEAQELFHAFETDAFHAGAQTGTASNQLNEDGFATGRGMWRAWDKWRSQSETLLSACAHIHNHLEDTVVTHVNHEEELKTNFSMSKILQHFS